MGAHFSAVLVKQNPRAMGCKNAASTGAVQTMEIFKREKINKLSSVAPGGPTLRTSTLQGSPESSKIDRREWSLADHDPLEVRFHADILLFVLTASCRQLVMLSTTADTKRVTSLAVLGKKAKKNDKNSSRSPYSYVEGEGGASGSFRCVPFFCVVQVTSQIESAALASCQGIGLSQSTIRHFLR